LAEKRPLKSKPAKNLEQQTTNTSQTALNLPENIIFANSKKINETFQ
jgi:hypothetical protein